ncbi:MAG: adenylate kinase [Acidimicrobiia bacterium]
MRLLFIGPPGAGKGTQASRVAERLGIPHISTGEMFRDHVARGTELGKRVEAIMAAGDYVPDEITVEMLRQRLAQPDATRGFILDGFPRTVGQVRSLDELIGEGGLDRVVIFEVDDDELLSRMLARGRADDTAETIRKRFQVYREQTQPLIDIYEERGVATTVNGTGELEEVTQRILALLDAEDPAGVAENPR